MSSSVVEPLEGRVLFAVPAGFAQSSFASGLTTPTAMAFAPDGRLFVTEQGGAVRVVSPGGQLLPAPFATVPARNVGEQGLLCVTFDPAYAENRYVYIHWITQDRRNRITRYAADQANPNVAAAGSEQTIFEGPSNGGDNHNGGALHFGADGKLYVALGERGDPSQSQPLTNPFGKVLRINPDGTIPTDNPFYDQTTGINRAIWACGLRNPFTMAVQPGTGRIFINDVGWASWEEVNEGRAGANYGWPATEGTFDPARFPDFTNPLFANVSDWPTRSIAGGAFYSPQTATFPSSYVGDYFVGDYVGGLIQHVDLSGPSPVVLTFATEGSVPKHVDLDLGPDGNLYALARGTENAGGGFIARISYTGTGAPTIGTQPDSRTVPVGQRVTFTVAASGAQPLRYQWQRNGVDIPGATASSYTLPAAQLSDNGAKFRVVVSNASGSVTSNEATLTVTANQPPTATITAPAAGSTYRAGDTINFTGTGTDLEDGALPPGAYTWTVVFHHDDHTHPAMAPVSGQTGGSYTIPTVGETAEDVWYRIHLTVRDSQGLEHSTFRDVQPQTVNVMLAANVPGLTLDLDGHSQATPHTFTGVMGITRSLGAPPTQTVGGVTYEFIGWSDGGAAQHTISTPSSNTTYTATYRPVARVLGRQVFYSRSRFDTDGAASGPGDDSAIATDKVALLPGQAASFANYTSYGRGINGIMIDLDSVGAPVGAGDFAFRVGRDGDPSAWDPAPKPLRIERREGAGAGGSDRVTVAWADGAIRNKWLQVTYLPEGAPATSLSRDVFYFGNLVGETGDTASPDRVSPTDLLETRRKLRTSGLPLTDRHDVNRDGRISVTDFGLVRRNLRAILPAVATGTSAFSSTPVTAASISEEILGR